MIYKLRNILFLSTIIIVILAFSLGMLIRGQRSYSVTENRRLNTFSTFNLTDYIKTDFQSKLEQALSDQLILSGTLKHVYNGLKNNSTRFVVSSIRSFNKLLDNTEASENTNANKNVTDTPSHTSTCQTIPSAPPSDETTPSSFDVDLIPRGSDLFELSDSHHLIYKSKPISYVVDLFQKRADNYNLLAKNYDTIQFFVYYIETDMDINFLEKKVTHELIDTFTAQLNETIQSDYLSLNSKNDYQNYFYKTDHHWDVNGQLEGYKEIITLLKGSDEPLLDITINDLSHIDYYGYKARHLDDYTISDPFKILTAKLPTHTTKINGQLDNYNHKEDYLSNDYSTEKAANHYGLCNGGDFGLVHYLFENNDENIVIFVDSFSNPINELLASHYKNTYIIDLRNYEINMGEKFDFSSFLANKEIDNVLFMGYYLYYVSDAFMITD